MNPPPGRVVRSRQGSIGRRPPADHRAGDAVARLRARTRARTSDRRVGGAERHDGAEGRGRDRSGARGAPGAFRGGGMSKSVAKAPRAGIGREGHRGIPTFLLARSGAIGAFATDLDKRRRRGHSRRVVAGRLFRGGFEGVEREGRGDGLLGRFRRPVPASPRYASRMVGRRLACRDAPWLASTSLNPRARRLTREIVT